MYLRWGITDRCCRNQSRSTHLSLYLAFVGSLAVSKDATTLYYRSGVQFQGSTRWRYHYFWSVRIWVASCIPLFIALQHSCNANRDIGIMSCPSVRLSVRLSVCYVPVLYRNSLTYHRTFFILVFSVGLLNICAKFRYGHWSPPLGRWIQVGYINFAIFDYYYKWHWRHRQLDLELER